VTDAAGDTPSSDAPRDAGIDAPPDAAMPTWTLVQTGTVEASTTLSLGAKTTTGSLIIVGVQTTATVFTVTDDGANLYSQVPNATGTVASAGLGITLWTAKSSIAAKTIMVGAPSVNAVVVWEVAGLRATSPLDTSAALSDQAATTLPGGATVITTQPGDFIVEVAIVANQASGIHAGNEFTNDSLARGNGWAHITSTAATAGPHRARWDQPTAGAYCAASAAFFTAP
jgi:hypothetical protein